MHVPVNITFSPVNVILSYVFAFSRFILLQYRFQHFHQTVSKISITTIVTVKSIVNTTHVIVFIISFSSNLYISHTFEDRNDQLLITLTKEYVGPVLAMY